MVDSPQTVVQVSIAMIVLATISTLIRVWSRVLQRADPMFWWDDYFVFLLLPLCIIISSLAIGWATVGLGRHTYEVLAENPANLTIGLKYMFWGSFVYELGISAAKFSALFFYVRVFGLRSAERWWKLAIWGSFAFSAAWTIMAVFLTIFQCNPVFGAWDKMTTPAPKCLSPTAFFVPNSAINFANDLIIVIIPIPRVVQLQMKPLRKVLVVAVLLCGYITVFMTIGQLALVVRNADLLPADVFYYAEPIMIWGNTQPSVALISLCLPSAFHLAKRAAQHGGRALLSSRDYALEAAEKNNAARARVRGADVAQYGYSERASLRPLAQNGGLEGKGGVVLDEVELGDVQSLPSPRVYTHAHEAV